jgi:hypothetical protein
VSNTTRTQGLVGLTEILSPRPARALAAMGVVLVAVELVVGTRWITSPQFERVPVGASPMEGWRSALLQTMQIGFTAGGVIALYVFLVRPWIRERRLTFDGLLAVSTLFVSIYDPLSSYWHYWFTYNAYFLNRGSAVTVLPGWVPFAEPGQQIAWPLLLIPGEYVVLFVLLSMLGCKILRAIHRRWSGVRGISWIAAGTLFVVLASVSLLLEGFLLLPLVERGTEQIKSHRKANLVRFLSVFAFVQLLMFFLYHLPVGLWTLAEKDAPWQDSMINNTWMNNGICGAGTPRLCPGQTELVSKP